MPPLWIVNISPSIRYNLWTYGVKLFVMFSNIGTCKHRDRTMISMNFTAICIWKVVFSYPSNVLARAWLWPAYTGQSIDTKEIENTYSKEKRGIRCLCSTSFFLPLTENSVMPWTKENGMRSHGDHVASTKISERRAERSRVSHSAEVSLRHLSSSQQRFVDLHETGPIGRSTKL